MSLAARRKLQMFAPRGKRLALRPDEAGACHASALRTRACTDFAAF
jgi:hypothetical protein